MKNQLIAIFKTLKHVALEVAFVVITSLLIIKVLTFEVKSDSADQKHEQLMLENRSLIEENRRLIEKYESYITSIENKLVEKKK